MGCSNKNAKEPGYAKGAVFIQFFARMGEENLSGRMDNLFSLVNYLTVSMNIIGDWGHP